MSSWLSGRHLPADQVSLPADHVHSEWTPGSAEGLTTKNKMPGSAEGLTTKNKMPGSAGGLTTKIQCNYSTHVHN